MNIMDLIIVALLMGGLYLGYSRGLVRQSIHLVGFIASYFLAFKFYDDLAPIIQQWFPLTQFEQYNNFSFVAESMAVDKLIYNAISFAIIFFGTKIGLTIVGHLLHLVASVPGISFINRWGGLLLGFLEVTLLLIIAVNVLAVLPWEKGNELLSESVLATYMIEQVPVMAQFLQNMWQ